VLGPAWAQKKFLGRVNRMAGYSGMGMGVRGYGVV